MQMNFASDYDATYLMVKKLKAIFKGGELLFVINVFILQA